MYSPIPFAALLAEQAYMEKSMRRYSQEKFAVELSALLLKLPCQLAKATKLYTGQKKYVHRFLALLMVSFRVQWVFYVLRRNKCISVFLFLFRLQVEMSDADVFPVGTRHLYTDRDCW